MVQDMLSVLSGTLVGVVLGLIGGGGSILAVPLLVYVVGVPSTHVAIGTSAVAVALSALSSLITHARAGNVRWPCALVFAACGMVGGLTRKKWRDFLVALDATGGPDGQTRATDFHGRFQERSGSAD
ncbi:MAG: sulfite exporter TauE/SafE family protein, partial [Nitrobacter sp.]|nr:sulfite exporter TauE/SafE family protein [Nitrobacter sp.]